MADESGPRRAPRLIAGGLSILAGLGPAFAFPPFAALPGLAGFALLLALFDRADAARPLRSAFWRGWLAGTAFFGVSTWWVYQAFQVDAADQGWMAPFAVALLASGLGLFWGAAGAAYRALAPRGIARLLVFAGVVAACEWLRGHLLTGFPWDLPGESWRAGSPISAGRGGRRRLWPDLDHGRRSGAPGAAAGRGARLRGALACVVAGLSLAGLYARGPAVSAHPPAADPNAPLVRIVQANLPEVDHYDAASYAATVHTLLGPDSPAFARPARHHRLARARHPRRLRRLPLAGNLDARCDHRRVAARPDPDHRRLPFGRGPARSLCARRRRLFQQPAGAPARPARRSSRSRSMTSFGWCRSANICRSPAISRRWHVEELVHVGDGFTPWPAPAADRPGRRARRSAADLLRGALPGLHPRRRDRLGRAAGLDRQHLRRRLVRRHQRTAGST